MSASLADLTPEQFVLRELDFMWRSGGVRGAARSLATFAVVIQGLGEKAWSGLPAFDRAARVADWLAAVGKELRDQRQRVRWRFRRAWEVAPSLMLGCDLNEASVFAAARRVDADRRRAEVIANQCQGTRRSVRHSMRSELDALVERYARPPEGRRQWACLVEAIDVAVDFLPHIEFIQSLRPEGTQRGEQPSSSPLERACFALATYDAMCPGRAHALSLDALHEALRLRERMKQRTRPGPRAVLPREALREPFWSLIRRMTGPSCDANTLARRWPSVRKSVRLDRDELVAGLFVREELSDGQGRYVPRSWDDRMRFAPLVPDDARWVEHLLNAVRRALPPKALRTPVSAEVSDEGPPLPEAFVAAAEEILPPVERGLRGPVPMTNRDALAWIIRKFRSGVGWKHGAMPSGTKYQRRFHSWPPAVRERLAALAADHRVLGPEGVEALRSA